MLGQLTNYLSAYAQGRVYLHRLYAPASTQLVTNANGAIPKGEVVTKAVWSTYDTTSVVMSDPEISADGRSASIRIKGQYGGWGGKSRIRVDLTTNAGNTISTWQVIQILGAPYVDQPSWVNGPKRVEATA